VSDITRLFRLDGRAALVTGAGRGIGRACAEALAQAGAEVHLMARSRGEIDEVAAAIRAAGGAAHAIACDVTDTQKMQQAVAALPVLDVLVNNAGSNIPEPFVDVSEGHLDRLLTLNVRSAFLVAQAAVRKMLAAPDRKARGGAILHMSSQMGHVGGPGRTVYSLTKHALEGLTKAMALEFAQQGIRVLSIAPTFIDTPLYRKMAQSPGFADWVRGRIAMGRVGQAEEVAAAVVFAASPAASLMTGTSLLVDGGWTAQ
jgi:NAD(P)-dependent dehydrogenase (short-subunit alcohol dehydrogenase family)